MMGAFTTGADGTFRGSPSDFPSSVRIFFRKNGYRPSATLQRVPPGSVFPLPREFSIQMKKAEKDRCTTGLTNLDPKSLLKKYDLTALEGVQPRSLQGGGSHLRRR
jgi:hypothetical protein